MDIKKIKKALLIIDVQNDFVTGSLGSEYAKDVVVPNIVELTKQFDRKDIYVTMDTHFKERYGDIDGYINTQEGKILPIEHCMQHTWGWEIVPELKGLYTTGLIKVIFGMDHGTLIKEFKDYDEVHICGLVTDICVITNVLEFKSNLQLSNIKVVVHENCCGGTSKEAHDAAIMVMKSCQINIE